MTVRSILTPAERKQFPIGAAVRYKPGVGVYGFEDLVEADGRLPAVVLGYTDTRVRLEVTVTLLRGRTLRRSANAASLVREVDVSRGTKSDTPPLSELA